jgi:hypothetical protein
MGARPGAATSGPNDRSAAGPLDVNCARRPLAAGTATLTCISQGCLAHGSSATGGACDGALHRAAALCATFSRPRLHVSGAGAYRGVNAVGLLTLTHPPRLERDRPTPRERPPDQRIASSLQPERFCSVAANGWLPLQLSRSVH